MKIYKSRKDVVDAMFNNVKNNDSKEVRRDLEKILQATDSLTSPGRYFMGRYWADRAVSELLKAGCALVVERLHDCQPHYIIAWESH
jgi:hypothetical protein